MANQPTPAQQAAAIVHAQYVPIDYALAQQRQQDAKAQAALQAAGHALIAQLQGGIKPAGQAYDAAVNQQQALAQGGAHLLAGLNPNAQIQSNLQQIGAPVEQQQMLQRQTQAQFPGQGGVLNIEQGTIPGASLVAQKAAAQQFLAGLPALAGLSQQRSAQGLAAQAAQNRQALYGQRLQAAAQIPQLAQSIGSAQASQNLALQNFLADQAYRQSELNQRSSSQKDLNAYRSASLNQRSKATGSRGGSAGLQYKVNKDGSVSVFNPNTGKITKASGPTPANATSKFTATQVQKWKGTAANIAYWGNKGVPAKTNTAGLVVEKAHPRLTYNQALGEMKRHGIPLPIAVAQLNQVYPIQYAVTKRGNLVQIKVPSSKKASPSPMFVGAGPVPGS